MASPTQKPLVRNARPSSTEVIDPLWLIRAVCFALLAAALFGYLTVCLLVYQGGWQRMLHPSSHVDQTPAIFGIPYESVRFDAATGGVPRLTAWWMPSDSPTAPVILFLHDGDGSLSTALPALELLRRSNVSIFAVDYRGYGQSQGPHPTEARMQEDASAALDYLVNTRHLPPAGIVPYGMGLGGVIALNLAAAHPELPAVIVDYPDPGIFERVTSDEQARLLPMRLLVKEHFDLAAALTASRQPKLLMADHPGSFETARVKAAQTAFRAAPGAKMTVTFGNVFAEQPYLQTLKRFLDENVRP